MVDTTEISCAGPTILVNHARMVPLDNSDMLMITGRFSAQSGCGGSYGNWYGITVYPTSPNYYSNPKIFVGSYMQQVAPYLNIRGFTGWSTSTEITYAASTYNSCSTTPAFLGNVDFYVR